MGISKAEAKQRILDAAHHCASIHRGIIEDVIDQIEPEEERRGVDAVTRAAVDVVAWMESDNDCDRVEFELRLIRFAKTIQASTLRAVREALVWNGGNILVHQTAKNLDAKIKELEK